MTVNDLLAATLQTSFNMLKMSLGDMTQEDLLQRPVPGANDANWQLGHLFSAEKRMLAVAGGNVEVPAGFAERYTKQTASSDDASAFLTKDELLAVGETTRSALIAWVKSATDAQLNASAPEQMRRLAATIADLMALQAGHTSMHTGQIQVLRRKLGKPVLF